MPCRRAQPELAPIRNVQLFADQSTTAKLASAHLFDEGLLCDLQRDFALQLLHADLFPQKTMQLSSVSRVIDPK